MCITYTSKTVVLNQEKIVNLREARGITLRVMSGQTKISYDTLRKIENGDRDGANIITLLRLCKFYGLRMEDFLSDQIRDEVFA